MQLLTGSAAGFGAIPGLTAASDDAVETTGLSDDVETTELSDGEARRQAGRAMGTGPVREMRKFLNERSGVTIDPSEFSGSRVDPDAIPHEFVSLHSSPQDGVTFGINVFEQTATVNVYFEDTGYTSNPSIVGDDLTSTAVETDANVLTSMEWKEAGVRTTASFPSRDCDLSGTFDTGGPACLAISALGAIGSGILFVIPEPGTTAVGTVGILSVLSGSCTIAEAIDYFLAPECNFTEIGMCLQYNCWLDPLVGVWCEVDAYVYPVC